jgi:type VI secretion system protein ImpL
VSPSLDPATLASFQRAASIRDMYFPLGGNQPQLRFTLQPDAGAGSPAPVMTLGNTSTGNEPASVTSFTWPGADGMSTASLRVGTTPAFQESGPWALFRLLGKAEIQPGGAPQTFRLVFDVGGQSARFILQAGSSHNPFGRNALAGFRCPVIK